MSATTLVSVRIYIYNQSESQLDNISSSLYHKVKLNELITREDLNDISQMNQNIDINLRKGSDVLFTTGENYNWQVPILPTNGAVLFEVGESNLIYTNTEYMNIDGEIYTIQVIKDMDNERAFIHFIFWVLLALNGLAFCISIALGYLMSKRALNPIEKIVKQAKKITVSDLSQRINIEGPDDELKQLSETFNELISRVEVGYEKQNRFALDASHELATPLAVIKGYLDIIGRWGKDEPKVLEEAISSMKNETRNMTDLLDRLLFIAKNDNEITKIEKTNFWLNELIIETYKEMKFVYPDYIFEIEANQSLLVTADYKLIKQLLRGLLDNSIKYSDPQTTIWISSKHTDKNFELTIRDQGIGISTQDIPHIFDRFYRVDKARNRDIGGSGLGLSIVKWIVDIHEGTIMVDSTLGKGTNMKILIPINK